jgi:hypothetical protein
MNSNNFKKIFMDSPSLEWLVSALALRCIEQIMYSRLHEEQSFMRSQQFFSWSKKSTPFVELCGSFSALSIFLIFWVPSVVR